MKILWVCNIMLPLIAGKLGLESSNKEGWLSGLCESLLERKSENGIELHIAYPVTEEKDACMHVFELQEMGEGVVLYAHGFLEDVANAEKYEPELEQRLSKILKQVKPDVIHCFGTEFAHTLAVARCCEHPERVLVGIQGLCRVIAGAYMADLPEKVQNAVTFRDWLKRDSLKQQQEKFAKRGEREEEIVRLVGNVTGRTAFDRYYVKKWNPDVKYFSMNETLRSCFYEGKWDSSKCEPHTIFMSQGDYPLKGLHYMLPAAGRLLEQYPDLKINIAGNSLVNYRTLKDKIKISAYGAYLRRLIKEQGLEGKVHFLGKLTAQEMKEQYLKSGLYICCSSNENSPNSLGEAMLLGVPCVAANVGGISSIFIHGEDGILYKGFVLEEMEHYISNDENNMRYEIKSEPGAHEKDAERVSKTQLESIITEICIAIEHMWRHPEKVKWYSENARKHARKNHDKEANYHKMTGIYATIANQER